MNPTGSAVKALVIGYGNELRGDDCAGRRVADRISLRFGGDVDVLSVHQLTPDLAPLVAESSVTIFADASSEAFDDDIRVRPLQPITPVMDDAHGGSPGELLGLASWLYGNAPPAYAIDISASSFEFSLDPSPRTKLAIDSAVQCIEELIFSSLDKSECTK